MKINKENLMKNANIQIEAMLETLNSVGTIKLSDLNPEETLLTIIDMNNGFAKAGNLYSPFVEAIIPCVENLAKNCKDKGIKIIAYTDAHTNKSKEFENYPIHCLEDTVESELIDELKEMEDIIILPKNSTNGFISNNPFGGTINCGTAFSFIDYTKIKNHIVTGCVTDICVYQYATSLKAFINENNLNAQVIVPVDCVDTFDIPEIHNRDFMNLVFLNSMISNGIKVVKGIK